MNNMKQGRIFSQPQLILDAVAADGFGTAISIHDFRHAVVEVATANSADATIQFAHSLNDLDDQPDFDTAKSVTNKWQYIHVYDKEDPGAGIAGDTGFAFAGTDDVKYFHVNMDETGWLNVEVSSYVAGNITVNVYGVSND